MEAVVRITDPIERSKAWLEFLQGIDRNEYSGLVASFRALGMTDSRMNEYSMLLSAWAKDDPLGALEFASESTGNRFAGNTVLTAWAAYDPEGAIQWARQNHDSDDEEEGNPWMVGVIRGLIDQDPVRASQLLADMPYSEERGEALTAMLPSILARGAEAAREWVEGIPDEQLKQGAVARIAEALAEKDPAGTAQWLASQSSEAAGRSISNVMTTWMESDRTAAVSYFQNLPSGEVRTNALRGITGAMAAEDPAAAASFLDANAGDANDRVYEQFVWHSFGDAPEIAIDYIGRIGANRQQERLYNRVLDGWLRRDYAAAVDWLDHNPLPDNVAERARQRVQEMQNLR